MKDVFLLGVPGSYGTDTSKWNAVSINAINYTSAFPAVTAQNVCLEKVPGSIVF